MRKAILLFLAVSSSSAYSADKWIGSLEGISRACETRTIQLSADKISWFNCKYADFNKIEQTESKYLIQIAETADCEKRGNYVQFVIEKKYGQYQTEVKIYKSLDDLKSDNFKLMCVYDIPRALQ